MAWAYKRSGLHLFEVIEHVLLKRQSIFAGRSISFHTNRLDQVNLSCPSPAKRLNLPWVFMEAETSINLPGGHMLETRAPHILAWFLLSALLLAEPSASLSASFGSVGSEGGVSLTGRYLLDSSISMRMEASLGDGFLSQRGQASGMGENSIHQTVSSGVASVHSSIASEGSFSLQLSSQAIDDGAGLIQGVSGSGDLVAGIGGQSGIFAAQSAAVVGGDLQTEQAVSAGVGVLATQDTDISGQTGRIGSQTLSSKDQMRVWGSFQGQGRLVADLSAGSAIGSYVDGQVRVDGVEWMGSEDLSRIAGSDQGLAVQGLRAMEDGVGTFGVVAESRASAGGQVATQALGGSSSSYAFTEPKWRWNTRDPKIQLYLRTDSLLTGEGLTAAQAQSAITAAANTWDDAVGQNLFADGTTVIPSSTVKADDPYDGVNVHAWKRLTNAPGALAYSRTRYDVPVVDGYYSVLESDVSYNTDVSWSTSQAEGTLRTAGQPFDVQTVALHELGHTIGLGDLYTLPSTDLRYSDWGQIMNSYDDVQRSLGSGDRTGAAGLYGGLNWFSGDFNGDGKMDLIQMNGGDSISTLISKGDGTFELRAFSPLAGYATSYGSWRVADINGDGRSDLQHILGTYINTWISNGDGSFQVRNYSPWSGYGASYGSWETGDINGDGRSDLQHILGTYINTWISNGDGTFQVRNYSPWSGYGASYGSWETGDINGDGRSDLQHILGTYMNTWISNGDGTFQVRNYSPWSGYGASYGRWKASDINGDGRSDLQHILGTYMNTWISNGDGTFRVRNYSPWPGYGASYGSWETGDINGDGRSDLQHIVGAYINTWQSNGDGAFCVRNYSPWPDYSANSGIWKVGDINGDGLFDLQHLDGLNIRTWISNGDGTFDVKA